MQRGQNKVDFGQDFSFHLSLSLRHFEGGLENQSGDVHNAAGPKSVELGDEAPVGKAEEDTFLVSGPLRE
jgi:hypothetical protein